MTASTFQEMGEMNLFHITTNIWSHTKLNWEWSKPAVVLCAPLWLFRSGMLTVALKKIYLPQHCLWAEEWSNTFLPGGGGGWIVCPNEHFWQFYCVKLQHNIPYSLTLLLQKLSHVAYEEIVPTAFSDCIRAQIISRSGNTFKAQWYIECNSN